MLAFFMPIQIIDGAESSRPTAAGIGTTERLGVT